MFFNLWKDRHKISQNNITIVSGKYYEGIKDISISNSKFISNYAFYGGSPINSIKSVHKDATHIEINWCNLVFENNSAHKQL